MEPSAEAKVYSLFALAMALTALGVYLGIQFTSVLFASGIHFFFLIAELAIIFTSGFWAKRYPLNYLLFGAFPLLSGFTITPYILYVLAGYANGASIVLNAAAATVFMAAAAGVFVRSSGISMASLGGVLFMSLVGLVVLAIAQIFVPAWQTGKFELIIAGAGVIIFALFTAFDLERVRHLARAGASPFMLALSLYLDIFNLFLYVLRLMIAISGERR